MKNIIKTMVYFILLAIGIILLAVLSIVFGFFVIMLVLENLMTVINVSICLFVFIIALKIGLTAFHTAFNILRIIYYVIKDIYGKIYSSCRKLSNI